MKPAKKKPVKKSTKSKSRAVAPSKRKATSKQSAVQGARKPAVAKDKLSETSVIKKIKTENLRLSRQLKQKERELEIEAALEKVRARTMAMQKSEELEDAANILFKQVRSLGIPVWSCGFNIWKKGDKICTGWMSSEGMLQPPFKIPLTESPTFIRFLESKEKGETFYEEEVGGKALVAHYQYMLSQPDFAAIAEKHSNAGYPLPSFQINHVANFKHGNLIFITSIPIPQAHEAFKRFAIVFEQTYTRFLDLQKAEAQARQAQIETAMEKVRARSLDMQKPAELTEVAEVLRKEMGALGVEELETSSIYIVDDTSGTSECWYAIKDVRGENKRLVTDHMTLRLDETWVGRQMKKFHRSKEKRVSIVMQGENRKEWINHCAEKSSVLKGYYGGEIPERTYHLLKFSNGFMGAASPGKISDESWELLQRATAVFSFAYKRFSDLQKAESQARESQIQLALERVRARTMAMQHSDELQDAAILLFKQMKALGVSTGSCGFNIWDRKEKTATVWMSSPEGGLQAPFKMPHTESAIYKQVFEVMKKSEDFFVKEVGGKNLEKHFDYLLTLPGIGYVIKQLRETGYKFPETMVYHFAFFDKGYLSFHLNEHHLETHDIFKRLAKVFEQTYTRFLDLQKAEAQAREAQIEAALERVRSRSLAMQNSEELKEVIKLVYQQLIQVKINLDHAGFVVDYTPGGDWHFWIADEQVIPAKITHPWFESVWATQFIEAKETGAYFFVTNLNFEEKNKFYQELLSYVPGLPEASKDFYLRCPGLAATTVLFENISLYMENFSGTPYSDEENKILYRFGKVFEQTYTRFLDLQKAEAQAREAQIEASLERVRTQAMAMHKSDDLLNISKVLYEELKMLGIDEIRNAMVLIHDEKNDFFLDYDYSSIGGKITRIPTNGISLVEKYVRELQENEKSKVSFLELIVSGEELESWKKARKATGQLDDPRLDSMEALYYYHYSIGRGNISISTFTTLSNEKLQVLERFRNVFQLPYQRYHDIEIAVAQSEQARLNLIQIQAEKKRAEDALTILKATQTQLIQSEKLASLGELTAGIAHEIQNPLNFVNNFSEVNKELLTEMQEEIGKGNFEEVTAIVKDVIANEEKINHHGKRADGIVKGMLQHSRSSSGVKEPTDINALADEYLRLSYHGLRAKDKSFNATLNTDYDQNIGNINIIPQDIGRVILNLINNAFYAVNERQKLLSACHELIANYEPTVSVSTKKEGNKVLISVKDNGNGIPDSIKEKIFQPFFTTKPTGQGTGLGLSLSYDIVKAHGGELAVETKEGKGSKFTLQIPIT